MALVMTESLSTIIKGY